MPAVKARIAPRCAITWLVLVAASACSPSTPEARSPGLTGEASAVVPDGGEGDASAAPRICMHDAKDLAPCTEECDRGIAVACTVLALRVERGDGSPRDITRAVRLHERACELRDAGSCVSAARMHASGAGVPPSRARQVELLAVACKLGDALACSLPAKAFANGTGVPHDERRATELWERACAGGVPSACEAIDAGE